MAKAFRLCSCATAPSQAAAGLQERIGIDIQGDGDFLTVVEVGDFLGARIGDQAGGG